MEMERELKEGDVVQGEVVALKPYGAFVELPNGEIGMIHISEVADEYVEEISSYLAVGDQVMVKVVGRNEEGKPNLSLRRLSKEEIEAARFSDEVERVRLALERGNGSLRARLSRREQPARLQREKALRSWIAEVRRELARLEGRHFGRYRLPRRQPRRDREQRGQRQR